jgi:hypothetical protein
LTQKGDTTRKIGRFTTGLGFVMMVASTLMFVEKGVRADKTKLVILVQDCDELNAGLISQNGGAPGFPAGNYIAGDACGDGNVGTACVTCAPDGAPGNLVILSNQPQQKFGIGQPSNQSCGPLFIGTCNALTECFDPDGMADGTCADAVEYAAQQL